MALEPVLELALVDQTGLELTEICLPHRPLGASQTIIFLKNNNQYLIFWVVIRSNADGQAVVAHTFNPSTRAAEEEESL